MLVIVFVIIDQPKIHRNLVAPLARLHLVVKVEFCGVELDEVLDELRRREGVSGIDEKNSRRET